MLQLVCSQRFILREYHVLLKRRRRKKQLKINKLIVGVKFHKFKNIFENAIFKKEKKEQEPLIILLLYLKGEPKTSIIDPSKSIKHRPLSVSHTLSLLILHTSRRQKWQTNSILLHLSLYPYAQFSPPLSLSSSLDPFPQLHVGLCHGNPSCSCYSPSRPSLHSFWPCCQSHSGISFIHIYIYITSFSFSFSFCVFWVVQIHGFGLFSMVHSFSHPC